MKPQDIKLYGSNKPGTADGQVQTDKLQWLGDWRSSTEVKNYKSATGTDGILGVTITTTGVASLNPDGAGLLTFTKTGNTLQWTAPTDTIGPAVAFTANATKTLYSNNPDYSIEVTVVFASLPGADDTDVTTIADHADLILNIMDDITSTEASTGKTYYRAIYAKNEHATKSFKTMKMKILTATPSTDDSWKFAFENPSNRAIPQIQEIADEHTQPTGLTWNAIGVDVALPVEADLAAGDSIGIWFERTVTAAASAFSDNVAVLEIWGDVDSLDN